MPWRPSVPPTSGGASPTGTRLDVSLGVAQDVSSPLSGSDGSAERFGLALGTVPIVLSPSHTATTVRFDPYCGLPSGEPMAGQAVDLGAAAGWAGAGATLLVVITTSLVALGFFDRFKAPRLVLTFAAGEPWCRRGCWPTAGRRGGGASGWRIAASPSPTGVSDA